MPTQSDSFEVSVPATKLFAAPLSSSSIETEALFGESLQVLTDCGRFYSVRSARYARPVYVRKSHVRYRQLHQRSVGPQFRIAVPRANIYSKPDFKWPHHTDRALTMNALVRISERAKTPEGEMAHAVGMGWLFSDQIHAIDEFYKDYVDVALMYVGGPATYTWGSLVLPDCSGLLQQVLWACGIACPRNVSEQIVQLGREVDFQEPDFTYRRGDFVFMFDPKTSVRHVVIMVDGQNCVHATIAEPHRGVIVQPLKDVIALQFKGAQTSPTMVRRFPMR